jgi:hypothetical protein
LVGVHRRCKSMILRRPAADFAGPPVTRIFIGKLPAVSGHFSQRPDNNMLTGRKRSGIVVTVFLAVPG